MSDTVIDLLKTGYPVLTLLYNVMYFRKKQNKNKQKKTKTKTKHKKLDNLVF